jgi:hypothetical protein
MKWFIWISALIYAFGFVVSGFRSVDTEEPPGTEWDTECERACSGFAFTDCDSLMIKVLPVGKQLECDDCNALCESLVVIYAELPSE